MGQLTASYDAGTAAAPLVGDTIGVALEKMVVAQPDVEALVSRHQSVRLSYAELGTEVEHVARGLLAVGIETGDRVGIWAPTCAEWTLLQFACARIGAILVNVNPAYRPNELAYALGHSGVRLLVTARSFKTSDYLAMLAGVRAELPQLEMVVTIDGEAAGGGKDLEWPAMVDLGNGIPADQVRYRELQLDTDDPINIQYTSGTTGNPKGATLTHHNILNNAQAMARNMGYALDRPGVHPCAALPLLRHGDRQLGLHRVGFDDGVPGGRLRPAGDARGTGRGALHVPCTACRRCSSPCSSTRGSPSSTRPRCARGSWPERRARSR